MALLSPSKLSFEQAEQWVKKHKFALLVSGILTVGGGSILPGYRGFYDIESADFRRITLEHINAILLKKKLSGPGECTYAENLLRIGVIYCELKNGTDFGPESYELKGLNKSTYVCTKLRLEANGLIDTKSGACFRGRITLLGIPEYYDRNGNKIDPNYIPGSSYTVPNQANQG